MSVASSATSAYDYTPFSMESMRQLLSGFAPLAVVLFILPWIMDFLPSTSDYRLLLFDGCNYRPLLFSNPLFRGLFHF